jgi:cysteine desulfurase/selenocysteine lyase
MSTSDGIPVDPIAVAPSGPTTDPVPPGLPGLTELTALANEFFRQLPTESTTPTAGPSPSAVPIGPALGTGPRTPSVPTTPVLSSLTATNPGPPVVSPAPVPPVPTIPPAAPPFGPTAGIPDSVPLFGGVTVPAATPVAAGSPVPMPTLEQFAAISTSLGYAIGFVGFVPDVGAPVPAAPDAPGLPVSASTIELTAVDEVLAPAPVAAPDPAPDYRPESLEFRPDLVPHLDQPSARFDPNVARADFPILQERVHGKRLIWLDNAATTQKPNAVIDRLSYFYEHENSNIHRAAHTLAGRATDAYEAAREKSRRFINAGSTDEIIFVRGTTEGINLIANSWGAKNVGEGDEILITWLEHHANIVPWQQLCAETGAVLRVAPVDDTGQVILSEYERLIGPRTKIVSFTQVSNALGTVTPAAEMIDIAHRNGVLVLLDGAQSVSHMRTDVQALDADFFVLSGHKVFGPTGIGVVYGKKALLDDMPPWQGGGNMIADVTFERTVYHGPPTRFEAGTGNIADAVGLGAALDYLTATGIDAVAAHEHSLLEHATEGLCAIPGLCIIGTAREKAGVISFVLDGFRTEDVGAALDREGIAVRSGHHCAQPILRRFGVEATVRPSFALYNTHEDVDALVAAVRRINSGSGSLD